MAARARPSSVVHARLRIDPAVVHARLADLDRTDDRRDRARPGAAVAGGEAVPLPVPFADKLGQVCIDLGFECRGEHRLRALSADFVQHRPAVRDGRIIVHYAQH